MGKPRRTNLHLPPRVYFHHGAHYHVIRNKWTRIPSPNAPQAVLGDLRRRYCYAKASAKARGIEFSISVEYVVGLADKLQWRCAVTDAPFSLEKFGPRGKRPLAPSIDRIDSTKGYVNGNVRVVCLAVNVAMNDWGEIAFLYLVEKFRGKMLATACHDSQNASQAVDLQ